MPGKKRSETNPQDTTGQMLVVGTHVERERARMGSGQVVSCFCPVCGRGIPENRVTERVEGKDIALEHEEYFSSIEWDPDKPFGMSRSAAGKKSFADWHYVSPEEAPELFKRVKSRFLDAVREWREKGWITKEELR